MTPNGHVRVVRGRGEAELLARCYRSALALADEHRLASVAFPALGCGLFRVPIDVGARVAVQEIARVAPRADVHLVAFDRDVERAMRRAVEGPR